MQDMRTILPSSRLLAVIALTTIPGCTCDPGYGTLGEHASDTESGGDSGGTGDASDDGGSNPGTGTTGTHGSGASGSSSATGSQDTGTANPACDPIQLADVAQGIGGFAMDGEADGGYSGWSVSGASDINGDGLADIIVGAYKAIPNGHRSGRSYVVFGKTNTGKVRLEEVTQGVWGFAMDGEAVEDESGFSVGGPGDVNGDGLADVVVGAPWADPTGWASGRTYVVFGKAGTDKVSLADVAQGLGGFAIDGDPGDTSGHSVNGAGDVNGDGLADVVVGAPNADPNGDVSGRAYVVFGKANANGVLLADVAQGVGGFAMDGENEGDQVGLSVSGAGDVNGDGFADVIVGTDQADPNGEDSGRAYVVFGKSDTTTISLADVAQGSGGFAMDGEAEEDRSGYSVSGAGDVNGDGLADVIVGAPSADPNGSFSGRAYVVFGKADTDKVELADVAQGVGGFAMDGENGADQVGLSVSGAGDLDHDGLADVVVGGATPPGGPYVVFGKVDTDKVELANVAQGIGGFIIRSEQQEALHAWTVDGAGDVNADGHPDVVVGAPAAPLDGDDSGRTYVVFGADFACGGG
jgi:hypothetical protein